MAYESKADQKWTRIEMLVALYSETIETLERTLEVEHGSIEHFRVRLRVLSLISAIESGVNRQYGEMTNNVLRLCEFVRMSVMTGQKEELEASIKVLQNLHDGFNGIRSEANEMERTGLTSKLSMTPSLQLEA